MLRFVYRQLIFDRARSVLTVGAVAAVVTVILVLEGFSEGIAAQLRRAVTDRHADLIVTQAGVSNMTGTRSVLPQFARRDVEAVEGVVVAHPLTGIPVIYQQRERRTPIFLLVYDDGGGPSKLAAGNAPLHPREIVVDHSLAKKHELAVGDALVVSDFEFRISGIASDAAAFFTPFAFARYDDLIDFYFESEVAADISTFPLVSFLLVELEIDADAESTAALIEAAVPVADVFLPQVLADEDAALGDVIFGPIMGLMVSVAYIVGVLVTGIILFNSVSARQSEFAVLKALGFSNAFVSAAVILEALLVVVAAIPIGVGLSVITAEVLRKLMPLYLILPIEVGSLTRTVVACLVFGSVGALLPIRMLHRVDPGLVFRN